jgi:hypothetical protein
MEKDNILTTTNIISITLLTMKVATFSACKGEVVPMTMTMMRMWCGCTETNCKERGRRRN